MSEEGGSLSRACRAAACSPAYLYKAIVEELNSAPIIPMRRTKYPTEDWRERYDQISTPHCDDGEPMTFWGYEAKRGTTKWRCCACGLTGRSRRARDIRIGYSVKASNPAIISAAVPGCEAVIRWICVRARGRGLDKSGVNVISNHTLYLQT